ncbi:hypothetical protein [Nonomuraea dietziae]|uniref:hypothetical protein n=1 Tax=Nonomuraea dietziae TaxID=65515 RepID=UPI0033DE354D
MTSIIRSRFNDLDLECLAKTAAELIMGYDPAGDLSTRQKEVAERAYRVLIDPGPDHIELPAPDDDTLTRVIVTFDAWERTCRTITVSVPVPPAIANDPDAIHDYLVETQATWDELAEHNDHVEELTIDQVRLGDQP